MSEPFALDLSGSFFDTLDRRLAIGVVGPDAIGNPQAGTIAMWCRIRDHVIGNPASQAYVADIIPLAIGAALGAIPGATSIDNTLRVIDPEPTDWALRTMQFLLMADTMALRGDGPDWANDCDLLSSEVTETDAPPDYPLD